MKYIINTDEKLMKDYIRNEQDFYTFAEDNIIVCTKDGWINWSEGDFDTVPVEGADNFYKAQNTFEYLEGEVAEEQAEAEEQYHEDYQEYYRNIGVSRY